MKKIGITAGVFLLLIVAGMFFINASSEDTEVTKEQTKVGMILNGDADDHSWVQSHYEGMEKSAKELNLKVFYKERVPEDDNCMEYIEELVEEGCEIIICNSFGYGEWIQKAAKEHPDLYFFHATGIEQGDNLSTFFGRVYQMRFLSGLAAGLRTETNEIGYVAAFPISEVNRGINAFTLGVRTVNPDAQVFVEWSNSWTGDEENVAATEKLMDEHSIDVLAMHMDSTEPLAVAEERGIWTVGYNIDNSEMYPDSFLTAPVWDWEKFYTPRILECLQGKFQGIHYWEGVETGIVALAPLTDNVKEGTAEVIEEYRKKLESGTFDVFYGPITDRDGNLRVAEGENMSDDAMLNEFDWYVEGVVTSEETGGGEEGEGDGNE